MEKDDKQNVESSECPGTPEKKLAGFEFWRQTLNSAKLVVAPMVDQSELAWRLLSRRHGAELCYSPMFHANVFIRDPNYRKEALATCPEDRPLIIQFCANDPNTLLKAARYAEPHCDAVDINLGCPQAIAKRGHYGAYLQDEWDLIAKMVSLCASELKVPITCKMRVFDDIEKTVRYAKALEKAGCQLLTVHGRTREQKGVITGLASWKHVKAIKDALNIPVFSNGNVQYLSDVEHCLQATGAEGVMSAEGNLHNPAIYEPEALPTWQLAEEYLDIVDQYPCPLSYVRGHMFKLFHHVLAKHPEARIILGNCKTMDDMRNLSEILRVKSMPDVEMYKSDQKQYESLKKGKLPLPYWLCQPYVRPTPEETAQKKKDAKRHYPDGTDTNESKLLSRNKQKKLSRNPTKIFQQREEKFEKCTICRNPKGLKCQYSYCKTCCKIRMYSEVMDCIGHRIYVKTKPRARNPAPVQTDQTQTEPTQAEPTQAEPTPAEPTPAEPTPAEPTQADPTQTEPTQTDTQGCDHTNVTTCSEIDAAV